MNLTDLNIYMRWQNETGEFNDYFEHYAACAAFDAGGINDYYSYSLYLLGA